MNASGTTMNCEEYRVAILAEPSVTFAGAGHADTCEACAAFRAEVLELDAQIRNALTIDVPALSMPELAAIDHDKVVSLSPARRTGLPAWIAIAASLAVAVFVGLRLSGGPESELSLADEILVHIDHEPGALRVTDVPVSDERLSAVVGPATATMDRSIGLISYAQSCVIRGHEVPHLVIQGKKGPITLILMPEEKIDAAQPVDGEGVHGVVLPLGSGSIAIVGERDEQLEELEKSVIDSVEWNI